MAGCSAASDRPAIPAERHPTANQVSESDPRPSESDPLPTFLEWEPVRVWEVTGQRVRALAGSDVVGTAPLGPENGRVAEVRTVSGRLRFSHRIGGDTWYSQELWIDDDLIGFLDASMDQHRARLTLMRPSGAPLLDVVPQRGLNPTADLSHGRVAYLTGNPSRSMCVKVVEPLLGNGFVWQQCGGADEALGDIALFEDRLSYTSVTDWMSPKRRCKRVYFVDLTTGEPMLAETAAANDVADCHAWSGMPFHGGVAFDVTDPYAGNVGESDVFIIPTGQDVVAVGRGSTDTIQACGAGVFWVNEDAVSRIMAWTHRGGPRDVLEPGKDKNVFLVRCAEGRWISGSRLHQGRSYTHTLIRADASSLD